MKFLITTTALCLLALIGRAQWNTSGNDIYNTNTGNVGIGTAAPQALLEVSPPGDYTQVLWPAVIRNPINNNSTGYGVGIKLKNSSYNSGEVNKWAGVAAVGAGSGYSNWTDLVFYTNNSSSAIPSEKFRITGAGNVGIGTTSPSSLLHVSSATGSAAIFPTTVSIASTTNASDWGIGPTWANLDFVSGDNSGIGAVARARIGAYMTTSTGSSTGLAFFTASTSALNQVMTIDAGGKVGFGTSAPTNTITLPSTSTGITLFNTADQTTNYERLTINNTASQFVIASEAGGTGTRRDLVLSNGGNQLFTISSTSPKFTLNSGSTTTASPYGLYSFTGTFVAPSGDQNGVGIVPTINQSGTAGYTALLINPIESSTGSGTKYLIQAQVGGNKKLTVDNAGNGYFAGNVGIGTTSPDQKLTVNGQVHSTSVVVTSTVPADYVFDTNYHLRPLTDVKAFVDKNHHLPEVPSAADFNKDGQNLGEMNMLLLKKVEELTLYLIEKDKQLAEQKTINQN
ncbi:MAG TPA: hypothetical protein VHA56_08640, partial [Mucilaginibacter sp.]|nr:hypothetical protein [Mucilaginibacter sp.]